MPRYILKYRLCSRWPFLSLMSVPLPVFRGSCPPGCTSGSLTLLHKGGSLCREQEHFEARERWLCQFVCALFIHSFTHTFIHACVHSFSKYLLSIYHVLSTVHGTEVDTELTSWTQFLPA